MADVADDRLVLHPRHVLGSDDVEVSRRGDEDVGGRDDVVDGLDLVAFHRCLERADRIDLGDDHPAALATQRLRTALADFTEPEDDGNLAAEHDISRTVDPVNERVTATIDVVELALGHRVVDVDRREQQRARFHHLVEAVNAGRRLLAHAAKIRCHLRPALRVLLLLLPEQFEYDSPLLGLALGIERGHLPCLLELDAFVHEQRRVPTVVHEQRRALAVGPHQGLARAPPILVERLTLPGKHGSAPRVFRRAAGFRTADDDSRGRMILSREDVAGDPANIGAELDERFDQHRRLNGHVQGAHDPRAGKRRLALVALPQGHQPRHLLLGQTDFLATKFGERQVLHLEGRAVCLDGFVK